MKQKTFRYTQGALDGVSLGDGIISASGWSLGLEGEVTGLVLECDGVVVPFETCQVNTPSPDVRNVFPAIKRSDSCRFQVTARVPNGQSGSAGTHLFSVVPMVGRDRGVPLERILPVSLPVPTAEQSVMVGHGDFMETSFSMLGLFRLIGGLQRDARVLDPGCGIGRIAYALFHYLDDRGRYCGFDVAKPAIDLAKAIFPERKNFTFEHVGLRNTMYNPGGKVAAADFTFPYGSGEFDFAVMTSVFTHLLTAETRRYLKEIARTLASGGRCFATFFALDDFAKASLRDKRASLAIVHPVGNGCYVRDRAVPEGAVAYDYDVLAGMIGEAGLVIDDMHWGSWAARMPYLSYQDVFLLRKP